MQKFLRQLYFFICIRILTLYYICLNKLIPPPVVVDPINEYVKPRKRKLLASYDKDIDLNANINKAFYNNDELKKLLKDEHNETEKTWKSRILYDSTPRGNIMMYYDIYKQGFAYYADQTSIPYAILNAMAMKYVVTFFCRDLFFDEETITAERMPNIFKEDIKVPNEKTVSNTQFAKFKQYKSTSDTKTNVNPVVKNLVKNRFISLGKLYNLTILKRAPIKSRVSDKPTSFDEMLGKKLSYKDFKSYKDFENKQAI